MTKHATVDDYVAALPDGVGTVFAALRETVLSLAPEAQEAIKYDMPCWRVDAGHLIYAAAWKKHIGLYPVYAGDAAFEAMVGPYRDKKDTVRFVYAKPMPFDVLERIVTARLAELEKRA